MNAINVNIMGEIVYKIDSSMNYSVFKIMMHYSLRYSLEHTNRILILVYFLFALKGTNPYSHTSGEHVIPGDELVSVITQRSPHRGYKFTGSFGEISPLCDVTS